MDHYDNDPAKGCGLSVILLTVICWGLIVLGDNTAGPKWRSCREHAAKYRRLDNHHVSDSLEPNRHYSTHFNGH